MSKNIHYPNTLHSILLTLGVFLVQFISTFILTLVIGPYILNNSIVLLGISFISFLLVVLIGSIIAKTSIKKLFIKSGKTRNKTFYLILLMIGCWCILASLAIVFTKISPLAKETQNQLNNILVGGSNIWFGIIYTVLLAPIIEEIFFRGVILQGLLKNYSIKKAIIISSILFAIMHFSIVQTPAAFFQGIVLAVIYVKTGSLTMSITGHIINNTLGVFCSGLLLSNSIYFVAAIGVILTVLSIYKVRKMPNNISCLLRNEGISTEDMNVNI